MAELLSRRDVAVLKAVSRERCEIQPGSLPVLFVDGRPCCDGVAAHRLIRAGLLARPQAGVDRRPAQLTPAGQAELSRSALAA